jgi:hypothetical protein
LHDEPEKITLTADQVAIINQAEAEIDRGDFLTARQMREYFNEKKSAWTTSHP